MSFGTAEPGAGALQNLDAVLDALEAALEAEARALAESGPDELLEATDRKRTALRTLERTAADPAIQHLLGANGSDAAEQFRIRLARCRTMNLAVGAAIPAALARVNQVLRLLGRQPEPLAYGAAGELRAASATKALAIG